MISFSMASKSQLMPFSVSSLYLRSALTLELAVRYILRYIVASAKYHREFIESFNALPKKWKKAVIETIEANGIDSIISVDNVR